MIDTPGILDHPLEERNTIEMQAITALAHLQCCVIYFMDISEQCGYTIEQQLSLFENIKPLFANKPLILTINKIDVKSFDALSEAHQTAINAAVARAGATMIMMSNLTEEGVSAVKNKACELLLVRRVEQKTSGKRVRDVMNRLTVTMPAPRDQLVRESCVPESVLQQREDAGPKPLAGTYMRGRDRRAAAAAPGEVDMVRRRTQRDLQVLLALLY